MAENFTDTFKAIFKLALQSTSEDDLSTDREIGYLEPGAEKIRSLRLLQPFVEGFIDAICSQGLHTSDLLLAQAVYYRKLAGVNEFSQYRLSGRVVGALLHAASREAEVEGMELP